MKKKRAEGELPQPYRVTAKGRVYWYAWRPGKGESEKARIHADPADSEAFLQEFALRLEERKSGPKGKLRGLITAYKSSDAWKKDIGAATRASWSTWLDRISDKFGDTTLAAFNRPKMRVAIRKWRDRWKATPRAADMGLQAFSRVLSFGVAEGELETNIIAGAIQQLYRNDRSMVIWTAEDLQLLAKHASQEVLWAAQLAALTGLRQGDLLRLSWSHVGELAIEIPTGKSRHRKITLIPLYAELEQLLAQIPKKGTVVLTNTKGLPWRTGFGSSWQDAIGAGGADIDKHFHDLRGTAATNFYVKGKFTEEEIAEIMTWEVEHVRELIKRYVKKDELLRDRIRRMNRRRTGFAKQIAKPV